ncbi:ROK family protein [Candidatus Pacearchaeota archaeon]|nr:ROK family protein [Candidatus Pacearchaeota archaeon]
MVLALDIGATNIRIAEVSGIKIKNKKIIPNPKKKEKALSTIISLITEYKKQPIGIGIASFMKFGIPVFTPNWDFSNVDVKSLLEKKFKVPVYIENDANCAALGEHHFGYGKGKSNFFLFTLGTGIGGGTVINNKLYSGHRGTATEPGHMIINGKHLEQLASGPASVQLAKSKDLKVKDTFELQALAKKGNKTALAVYSEVGRHIGVGMLNVAYILDPEIILLGGGFANVPYIYSSAKKALWEGDWANRKIPVMQAKLKDDAGLIGAGLLPRKE